MQPATERAKIYTLDSARKETDTEIHPHSIGQLLQACRERKKLSLKSVSRKTKIGTTNLEFLEKDQLHQLPDRAYVIGYVKSYSRVLGISEETSLELLEETYQNIGPRPTSVQVTAETAVEIKGFYLQRYIIITILSCIIMAAGIFFVLKIGEDYFFKTSQSNKISKVDLPVPPQKNIVKPQTLNEQSPLRQVLQSPTEPEAPLLEEKLQNETATEKLSQDQKTSAEETSENEAETSELKFYPFVRKLYDHDNQMDQNQINELIPSRFRSAPQQGKQNIYITTVTGDTWLTYKVDGKPIRQFTLKRGKGLFLQGNEVRVFLGNLGAVKIFLNNKPLAISSRSGVKNLVFPQENRSRYVMPLFIYNESGVPQTSENYIKENDIDRP